MNKKYLQFIFFFFFFLIPALICLISLFFPYGRDQGIYAYAGQTILEGGCPYKDVWDFKPPLIYFVYALSFLFFGKSMLAIRLLDLVWQILAAVFMGKIAGVVSGEKLGELIIPPLYLALYFAFGFWHTAQSDGFVSLVLSAAVVLFLKEISGGKKRLYLFFFAGGLFSLAFLFKYTFALVFLGIVLLYWLGKTKDNKTHQIHSFRPIAELFLGYMLPLLIMLGYLTAQGALGEFMAIEFQQTPQYVKMSLSRLPFFLLESSNGTALVVLTSFFLLVFLYFYFARKLSFPTQIVFLWAAVGFMSVFLQAKFFHYHFLPIIGPGLIVLFCAFQRPLAIFKLSDNFKKNIILVLSCLIVLLIFGRYFMTYTESVYSFLLRKKPIETFYSSEIFDYGDFSLGENIKVSDYIKENTLPTDKIYVWGFEPVVYLLAKRACSSRFIYNVPLFWKWEMEEYKQEFLKAMASERPSYFAVVRNDALPWVTGISTDSRQAFEEFKELKIFIDSHYDHVSEIGDFILYQAKQKEKNDAKIN